MFSAVAGRSRSSLLSMVKLSGRFEMWAFLAI